LGITAATATTCRAGARRTREARAPRPIGALLIDDDAIPSKKYVARP
jgi:hypothetical protein